MKRLLSFRPFLAVIAIVLVGCGGGGGSGSSSGGGTGQVHANVRVIPSDGSVTVNRPDASTLVLTGSVPPIVDGDVLVSSTGEGFLRKAKKVTRSREGELTITTEPGTLEDVFSNAEIAVVRTLGAEDVLEQGQIASGVTVEPSSRVGGAIRIGVPERVIAQAGGVAVKLDGGIDLSFDLDFQLRVSGLHIQHCRAVLTSSGQAQLRVRGGFNGINVKHKLTHLSFKPITIYVGTVLGVPVPLVIKTDADIFVTVRGDMAAEFTATATASATVQGGAEFNGSDWSLVKSFNKGFDLAIEKNFSTGSVVTFCPILTEATVKLYDVVGPNFSLEPNFVCRYDRQSNPNGLKVNVQGAFTASAGIRAEAMGRTWVDRQFPNLLNANFNVFDRFFPDSGGGGGTTGGGGGGGESGDIVVDNSQTASGIDGVGFWKWGTPAYWHAATGLGINGSMLWTQNNQQGVQALDNVGQWRPNLPAGRYEIFAFIPRNNATTKDANYEIWIAGNNYTTVHVNQFVVYDAWVSLGTYDLPAGSNSFVRLLDVTNEPWISTKIGFDAMKWVRR